MNTTNDRKFKARILSALIISMLLIAAAVVLIVIGIKPIISASVCIVLCALVYFLLILKPAHNLMMAFQYVNSLNGDKELTLDRQTSRTIRELDEMLDALAEKKMLANKDFVRQSLQNQINPHFLYNTLEAIRAYALEKNVPEISDITESMASIFRYNVVQQSKMATIREELNIIECYLKIQNYRFPSRFHFHCNLDTRSKNEILPDCIIPALSIQPLIENAVYHGLERKVGEGHINLDFTLKADHLVITISDDGIGIPAEKLNQINQLLAKPNPGLTRLSKRSGIALVNINKRLKLEFGPKYGLSVYSTVNEGTQAVLIVPVIHPNYEK